MPHLKVYKASAGSGKTFRLVVEYLKLALSGEMNYRHILAVTFTNKATAEMKLRIISELHKLADNQESKYLGVLSEELKWSNENVILQAKQVLRRILHDYSRFSISTIESFFQRIIKAFNRELGINATYNVELDENSILEEATDRLIMSIEEDSRLKSWLEDFALEKIREGKGWNLKKDIVLLGKEIFNEAFKSFSEDLYQALNDHDFIYQYKNELNELIFSYENQLKNFGKQGQQIIREERLDASEFKGKSRSLAMLFPRMEVSGFSMTENQTLASVELSGWVAAGTKEPDKSRLESVVQNRLIPLMQQVISYMDNHIRDYTTAKLISSQLYTLGILVDLWKCVRDLCKEKGILLISDSGYLLRDVISDSEAPFVYEKTGAVYHHYMIDEFQDTSGLQWNNFRPLVNNALSEGNNGLLVGDVKQAIYRWRNGDWRLLAGKLEETVPVFGIRNEVLNSNWRSHGNIIRFNNAVFSSLPVMLQQYFESELINAEIKENPISYTIPQIYADAIQELPNEKLSDSGYIRVKLLENNKENKDDNQELILKELLSGIKELQDQGVKAGELAILVRKKDQARLISELFLEQKALAENGKYNFEILSNESLYVVNSDVIGFIIAVLRHYLNPNDLITEAEINYQYYNKIKPKLSQHDKLPNLEEEQESGQSVLSFASDYTPDIHEQFEDIQDERNQLIHFLNGKTFEELLTGKPVQEIVYSICEQFNLFELNDELAYLQAFIDQIAVFERNYTSEITSFLDWWEEHGAGITISVSEGIDAITVLTIHKAKGLEYSYVFVPFCDWDVKPMVKEDMAPLLWCEPDVSPFNQMKAVPVRYKADLANSHFYKEYFTEKYNTYVDNLNLLYVAFTRAKKALWAWARYSAKDNKCETVGDLLYQAFTNASPGDFLSLHDVDLMQFEYGTLQGIANDQFSEKASDIRLDNFEFTSFRHFLNIRKRSKDFFAKEGKKQELVNRGRIIHEILSMVVTHDDLDKAIKRVVFEGKLAANEVEEIRKDLDEILNDAEVSFWFNGSYRVVNERNILLGNHGLKRPDRIMIGNDKVVVVDYKSGDVKAEKYNYQLRSYIKALKDCGYDNVQGYLWYTKTNERIRIS